MWKNDHHQGYQAELMEMKTFDWYVCALDNRECWALTEMLRIKFLEMLLLLLYLVIDKQAYIPKLKCIGTLCEGNTQIWE